MKVTKWLFLVNGCVMNIGVRTYQFSYDFQAEVHCRARKMILEIQLALSAWVLRCCHEHYRAQHLQGVPVLPWVKCPGSTPKVQKRLPVSPGTGEEEVADPRMGWCSGSWQAAPWSSSWARRDQNSREPKLVMLGKGDVPFTPSGLCHTAINGLSIFCCH